MKESLKLAVERAKRGESEGFSTIYRETCADVYFRARLILGNRGEARELIRQVYLVVFRTISTLQDPEKMEKWLYTVLYKLGERECQKKKGMILEKEKTAPSWEGQRAPETTAERQQIVRILKSSYKKIGTAGRLVCLAYYYEGWSMEELSHLWKCPAEKLEGILEYARIELGLMCTQAGYLHVDISSDMMVLMFELLREDAEEEIRQARLGKLYEELEGELDIEDHDEPDEEKSFFRKWFVMIIIAAVVIIGLAAVGGNYLGQLVTRSETEQKEETDQNEEEEKKTWSLTDYKGNWCDEANADSEVMSTDGICEIEIKSAADQRIVFDIRKTYGSDEDYVFRGANDVTGVVSDKKASFTFSDEYNNRMEGTIEFQDETLKVVVKRASGGQSEGLTAAMDCTMKRDQYSDSRTKPQEEEEAEDEDYIFPESDSRLLTEEDFDGKTKAELRLGRNEIFARHGRIFETEDLNEWFSSKDWYEPLYTADEFSQYVQLNQYERQNANRILEEEKEAVD